MRKWIARDHFNTDTHCVIEEDVLTDSHTGIRTAAFVLYRYHGTKGTHDYVQDSLEAAMEQANDTFKIPLDAWREVTEE